jgi:cytochrome b
MSPELGPPTAVRVWDLPTRLFHWTLAATIVGSVVSAKIGGNAMVWHFRFGYLVFTLLAFRIVWGFVGARWSRFASFVPTPGRIARYLRGQPRPGEWFEVGHNPLGSLSVLAMLALLALQVGTGLVADDEIANTGPLNRLVSTAAASRATHWHKDFGQYLIVALVLLHVAAILYHALAKKDNLVGPMLHGEKQLPPQVPASLDSWATRGAALVVAAACGAAVAWLVSLGG